MKKQFRQIGAMAVALLWLGGCAVAPQKDPAEQVKQRASERWKLLIDHQAGKAYGYLTPGYRATVSRDAYAGQMNNPPLHWTGVKVHGAQCKQDRCTVKMSVNYEFRMNAGMPGPVKSFAPLKETWLNIHGQWYYLPREEGRSSLDKPH